MMHKTRTLKPGLKFALTVLSWVSFAFLLLVGIFLLYYVISTRVFMARGEEYEPRFQIFTIISPSMEPGIKVYDVIVNTRVDSENDINTGDVITFISTGGINPGMRVTHRIIETLVIDGKVMYRTQGDNNATPDSTLVPIENVKGRTFMKIPQLGRLQFFLASRGGWFFAILLPAMGIIIYNILKVFKLVGVKKKIDKIAEEDNKIDKEKIEKEKIRKEKLKKKLKKPLLKPKEPEEIIPEDIPEPEDIPKEETKKKQVEELVDEIFEEIKAQKENETQEIPIPIKEESLVAKEAETKDSNESQKALDETIFEIKQLEERLQSIKSVIDPEPVQEEIDKVKLPKKARKRR